VKGPHELWLSKLRHLNPNISRTKGEGAAKYAPHKPLLLLALIDLAEASGTGFQPRVALSVDLRIRFLEPWAVVAARWGTKPDIRLPFFHLSTQGFWKPLQNDGRPAQSPESTAAIELHPEFHALLMSPADRALARQILVQTWFPPAEQFGLFAALGCEPDTKAVQSIAEAEAAKAATATGRDARFRVQVVTQYLSTCALTGYTLTTTTGATLVEAAHIADFASTRNNDPRNGLALTPNAHWAFDEHLWTVDEKLRIVVAKDAFSDAGPEAFALRSFHGRSLHFHGRASLRPHEQYLAAHRAKFVG